MVERLLDGRYRLRSVLGRGGMAAVWLGVDQRLGRPVAVKILDRAAVTNPSVVARFDREARTVARLAHRNVVAVHDSGVDHGVPYLVMEFVEGRSLADLLVDGPLDVDEAVRIAGEICDALVAAHAAGVVHRDVKPANVLVTAEGGVKVCDFGIARMPLAAQVSLTGADLAVGTSEYMAPEQATGGPVDHRTDLYALGCVLYAMLTGRPPFSGDTALRVAWQHVNQRPVPVAGLRPGIPVDVDALVGQLLAKDPANRPATAVEVRARLAGLPPPGTPTTIARATTARAPATAGSPVRGRAAVSSRTRHMPVLDGVDEPPGTGGRFRLGLAGVAVVVGAAILATLAVAALTGGSRSGPSVAAPSTAASAAAAVTSPATEPGPGNGSAQAVTAVRAAVQAQAEAGELDGDAAEDVDRRLGEIARLIGRGDTSKAADKVADLRKRLAEFRKDGRITTAGYDAVLASLDRLAASLPPAGKDRD